MKTYHQKLEHCLPDGLVVSRKWLNSKGFRGPLVDYYLRSGRLVAVGRGAYRRPGPTLKWEHVLYSLQTAGLPVRVGGQTALDLQGLAHYLPLQGITRLLVYGVDKLPAWVAQLQLPYSLILCKSRLFDSLPENALTSIAFGHWDWQIHYSSRELALFELLAEIKTGTDFEFVDRYFESMTVLRSRLINALLLACTSIKVKRLFMWFAERHHHQWRNELDMSGVNFGTGKRVIVKAGALNRKYGIIVPREMQDGSEQPVF